MVCCPLHTLNGHHYFISFIDYYSRCGYIYVIHAKSNSLDMFKIYKIEVDEFYQKIKIVISNRGSEYYEKYDEMVQQMVLKIFPRMWYCSNILFLTPMNKRAKLKGDIVRSMMSKSAGTAIL